MFVIFLLFTLITLLGLPVLSALSFLTPNLAASFSLSLSLTTQLSSLVIISAAVFPFLPNGFFNRLSDRFVFILCCLLTLGGLFLLTHSHTPLSLAASFVLQGFVYQMSFQLLLRVLNRDFSKHIVTLLTLCSVSYSITGILHPLLAAWCFEHESVLVFYDFITLSATILMCFSPFLSGTLCENQPRANTSQNNDCNGIQSLISTAFFSLNTVMLIIYTPLITLTVTHGFYFLRYFAQFSTLQSGKLIAFANGIGLMAKLLASTGNYLWPKRIVYTTLALCLNIFALCCLFIESYLAVVVSYALMGCVMGLYTPVWTFATQKYFSKLTAHSVMQHWNIPYILATTLGNSLFAYSSHSYHTVIQFLMLCLCTTFLVLLMNSVRPKIV